MTLPDVLRETIRRVQRLAHVTIAREAEGPHAYQIRFSPDRGSSRGYSTAGRRWVVEKRPGTEFEGWAPWSTFVGFAVESAIADDWKILIVEAL